MLPLELITLIMSYLPYIEVLRIGYDLFTKDDFRQIVFQMPTNPKIIWDYGNNLYILTPYGDVYGVYPYSKISFPYQVRDIQNGYSSEYHGEQIFVHNENILDFNGNVWKEDEIIATDITSIGMYDSDFYMLDIEGRVIYRDDDKKSIVLPIEKIIQLGDNLFLNSSGQVFEEKFLSVSLTEIERGFEFVQNTLLPPIKQIFTDSGYKYALDIRGTLHEWTYADASIENLEGTYISLGWGLVFICYDVNGDAWNGGSNITSLFGEKNIRDYVCYGGRLIVTDTEFIQKDPKNRDKMRVSF